MRFSTNRKKAKIEKKTKFSSIPYHLINITLDYNIYELTVMISPNRINLKHIILAHLETS